MLSAALGARAVPLRQQWQHAERRARHTHHPGRLTDRMNVCLRCSRVSCGHRFVLSFYSGGASGVGGDVGASGWGAQGPVGAARPGLRHGHDRLPRRQAHVRPIRSTHTRSSRALRRVGGCAGRRRSGWPISRSRPPHPPVTPAQDQARGTQDAAPLPTPVAARRGAGPRGRAPSGRLARSASCCPWRVGTTRPSRSWRGNASSTTFRRKAGCWRRSSATPRDTTRPRGATQRKRQALDNT